MLQFNFLMVAYLFELIICFGILLSGYLINHAFRKPLFYALPLYFQLLDLE